MPSPSVSRGTTKFPGVRCVTYPSAIVGNGEHARIVEALCEPLYTDSLRKRERLDTRIGGWANVVTHIRSLGWLRQ